MLFYKMHIEPLVTIVWAFGRLQTGWGENKSGPLGWGTRMRWPNPHPSMAPSSFSGATQGGTQAIQSAMTPAVSPPDVPGKGMAESG